MRHDEPAVRSYAVTHPVGEVHLPTQSGWDQIVYARAGLFVARTHTETWTVPPDRALCVGDGSRVGVVTRCPTVMRCLYLQRDLGAVPESVRVVSVTGLLRELLLHLVEMSPLDLDSPSSAALVTVLVDQLRASPTAPLALPAPRDDRCCALAELLVADPAVDLATALGSIPASRRTIERRFRAETGMTLAGWHRRARIMAAVELLATGASVTTTAVAVGYATPSSFVTAFRTELGTTPRRFSTAVDQPAV